MGKQSKQELPYYIRGKYVLEWSEVRGFGRPNCIGQMYVEDRVALVKWPQ